MQDKTRQEYLSLAHYFFEEHMRNYPTNYLTDVIECLDELAKSYRPDYWRRVRKGIQLYLADHKRFDDALKVNQHKNPVSTASRKNTIAKQARIKQVSNDELKLLSTKLRTAQDKALLGAVTLANFLGCRPTEMWSLKFTDDGTIVIEGAKKRETDDRGLNREVILPAELTERLKLAHTCLLSELRTENESRHKAMRRIQGRLNTVCRQIWPKRKYQISLYTFRHQISSNLKSSGMDRVELAAIMGHRTTDSSDRYGKPIKANTANVLIQCTEHSSLQVRLKQKYSPPSRGLTQSHNI